MSEAGAVRRSAAQDHEKRHVTETERLEEEQALLEDDAEAAAPARRLSISQQASRIGRSTDPLAFACRLLPGVKKLGHQYVLLRSSDGRPILLAGPHWTGTVFAQGLIAAVVTGFTTGATPIGKSVWGSAGMYFFGFLCTGLLWLTALSDPGILYKEDVNDAETLGEDGVYCDICALWGPAHTRHCRECGVCIRKHDHHCVWMGKCIGEGNMKPFVCFNMAWVSAFIFMFGCLGVLPSRGMRKKHHKH